MSYNQSTSSVNPRVRVIPARERLSWNSENSDGGKLKVAAYARVSTLEEHQSSSYDLQVSYYTDYIQKNPAWELYKVYADEGVTGTNTTHRTGFNQMIEDAKKGIFKIILTKSISRFARNTLDCISTVRMLKDYGVGIYFEKENIDTLDSKSELLLTILSSLAQEESRSISENTRWGVQKRFSQGKIHCPTTYFLGYDTDESGEIVINEAQAAVVKRIFREFLSGKGCRIIARELTQDGILTARGNSKWTSDAVYKLLTNEKYMGHCLAQKSVTLDFISHRRVRNREHQPQYLVKNSLPAIISEDHWHEVQQELKRRRNVLHNPEGKYRMNYSGRSVFSNKFSCGECGRPVTRRRLTTKKQGKKAKFTAWQCRVASGRDPEFKDCRNQYVWEEELEKNFVELLYEMKQDKGTIITEAEQIIGEHALTDVEEARLTELDQQIENVANRISDMALRESTTNDPVYDATMRHLIYEQEILQMERDELNNNKQDSIYLKKRLEEFLEYLDAVRRPNIGFDPDIFHNTVERGTVYRDHQVELIFKCGIRRRISVKRVK